MQQVKYWILTIPKHDFTKPTELSPRVQYLRGQEEIGSGDNRYQHWQLVVLFKRSVRLSTVKEEFGATCHTEPTRSKAALEYVWKEETAVPGSRFELGY